MFARAGIPFEFASDYPDLLIGRRSAGIEVGTRTMDSPWALQAELEQRMLGRQLTVALDFERRPLKSPRARLEEVADRIAEHLP